MKILFVSAWSLYPANNGSRIRAYNLLKSLAACHDVYLISLVQEDSKAEDAKHLEDICTVVSLHPTRWFQPGSLKSLAGYFSKRPRSAIDTYDPQVAKSVRKAVSEIAPDAILASTIGVAEYIPYDNDIPKIIDEHNAEYAVLMRGRESISNRVKRFLYDMRWKKTAAWETSLLSQYDAVVMVSEDDRDLILRARPELDNVRVVPNGVDVDMHTPEGREPDFDRMIYNGALTYSANLDAVRYFAEEIYPIISVERPELKLYVTGRYEGVDLAGIGDCPGVVLTGYVDDMRKELARSAVCAVPLRAGGGSRLKILEAMASGLPVVSTKMGAEGIDAEDGSEILVAENAAEFARKVGILLDNPDVYKKIAVNGRRLVESKYSWKSLGEDFVKIVEETVALSGAGL